VEWRRFEGGEVVEEEDCNQRQVSKGIERERGAGDGGGLEWEEFSSAGAVGRRRISGCIIRRLYAAVWR
jgi:hypothetical protein